MSQPIPSTAVRRIPAFERAEISASDGRHACTNPFFWPLPLRELTGRFGRPSAASLPPRHCALRFRWRWLRTIHSASACPGGSALDPTIGLADLRCENLRRASGTHLPCAIRSRNRSWGRLAQYVAAKVYVLGRALTTAPERRCTHTSCHWRCFVRSNRSRGPGADQPPVARTARIAGDDRLDAPSRLAHGQPFVPSCEH